MTLRQTAARRLLSTLFSNVVAGCGRAREPRRELWPGQKNERGDENHAVRTRVATGNGGADRGLRRFHRSRRRRFPAGHGGQRILVQNRVRVASRWEAVRKPQLRRVQRRRQSRGAPDARQHRGRSSGRVEERLRDRSRDNVPLPDRAIEAPHICVQELQPAGLGRVGLLRRPDDLLAPSWTTTRGW